MPHATRIAIGMFGGRLPRNVLLEDIVAAAKLGAWQTALKYSHLSAAEQFAVAGPRIRGAVFDELRAQDWLPRRNRKRLEPRSVIYVDDVGHHEIYRTLVAEQPLQDEVIIERQACAAQSEQIARAFRRIGDRDAWIVALRYRAGMRLKEIGVLFGVTEARISQMHSRAIAKLQEVLKERP